jgi:hypothetical protein
MPSIEHAEWERLRRELRRRPGRHRERRTARRESVEGIHFEPDLEHGHGFLRGFDMGTS